MRRKMFVIALFMLATLAWAMAQQPGSTSDQSSAASPNSQVPGTSQSQPSTPDRADQDAARGGMQAGSQGPAANVPVTEGCLGGSDPNYTVTDKAGTTYKLNIPPNADTSKLASHVGESVQVAGDVKNTSKTGNASIDVQGIGRGTSNCPTSGSGGAQSPPKQ